jgi:integrase
MPFKNFENLTGQKLLELGDGRHSDGNNLYLCIRGGSRAWVLIYRFGKKREMQLGTFPAMTLEEARLEALRWRRELNEGRDPLEVREAQRQAWEVQRLRLSHTLESRCRAYHEAHKHLWRNDKHADQWISSLEIHVFPKLGARPIASITAAQLLGLLRPLNLEHHETAKRIRQRLEAVWADAILEEITQGNPPAALIRHLRGPALKKNFKSLNYREVPGFVHRLRDSDAGLPVRLGLEFLILGCARTIEIRRARWADMNRADRIWRVPAELMKAGEPHDVPLTHRMLEILDAVEPLSGGEGLVFPGYRNEMLSDGAFLAVLRRMNRHREATVHGFRASFDTWASETTTFRAGIIEAALAHEEQNAVRAAYNRAEYWQQRVALADQWTKFVLMPLDQGATVEALAQSSARLPMASAEFKAALLSGVAA